MTEIAIPDEACELTRFIEAYYHARHRSELPRLASLARKVEHVHADSIDAPTGLADLLTRMVGQLEVHMKKEELILFPAIRQGGAPGIERPISVMRHDHSEHGSDIALIRALTKNFQAPADACRSWRTLYDDLETFVGELEAHIKLENDILFPQFECKSL